jgi:hypothetical protein
MNSNLVNNTVVVILKAYAVKCHLGGESYPKSGIKIYTLCWVNEIFQSLFRDSSSSQGKNHKQETNLFKVETRIQRKKD